MPLQGAVARDSIPAGNESAGDTVVVIFGTALLAVCYLLGIVAGDALGTLIGVKANVGGVGFAMILLIASLHFMHRHGAVTSGTERGVTFWAALYIPVVVAMSATQNVVVAFKSGMVAVLGAAGSVVVCAGMIAVINRIIERRGVDPAWQNARPSAESD
jgi:malonate transporter MadL subunit